MSESTRILESDDPCDNLELLDPHLQLGGLVRALRFARYILAGESQVTLSNVESVPFPERPGVVEEFNVALTEMCLPFLREAEEDIGRHLRMLSAELTVRVGAAVRSGVEVRSEGPAPEPPTEPLHESVRVTLSSTRRVVDNGYRGASYSSLKNNGGGKVWEASLTLRSDEEAPRVAIMEIADAPGDPEASRLDLGSTTTAADGTTAAYYFGSGRVCSVRADIDSASLVPPVIYVRVEPADAEEGEAPDFIDILREQLDSGLILGAPATPEPPKRYIPPAARQRVAVMQKAVDSLHPTSRVRARALGWLHGFEGLNPQSDFNRDYEEGWLEGVENAVDLAASEEAHDAR